MPKFRIHGYWTFGIGYEIEAANIEEAREMWELGVLSRQCGDEEEGVIRRPPMCHKCGDGGEFDDEFHVTEELQEVEE